MGAEATLYLLERGVRLTGTDGWSWDAPFVHTAKRYAQTHDASLIWEGHKAGRHIGYCHIEKLHNLESLPAHGFMIACFPVKIARASAGWTRAVAIIDAALNIRRDRPQLSAMRFAARRRRGRIAPGFRGRASMPHVAKLVGLGRSDPLFARVRVEAQEAVKRDPALGSFLMTAILNHDTLEHAVAHRVAERLVASRPAGRADPPGIRRR